MFCLTFLAIEAKSANSRMIKDILNSKVDSSLTRFSNQLDTDDRIPTDSKEVIVDTDLFYP